jgi:hypothetical protein
MRFSWQWRRWFWPYELWCQVDLKSLTTFQRHLTPPHPEGNTFLINTGSHLHDHTASQSRRPQLLSLIINLQFHVSIKIFDRHTTVSGSGVQIHI